MEDRVFEAHSYDVPSKMLPSSGGVIFAGATRQLCDHGVPLALDALKEVGCLPCLAAERGALTFSDAVLAYLARLRPRSGKREFAARYAIWLTRSAADGQRPEPRSERYHAEVASDLWMLFNWFVERSASPCPTK